MAAWKYHWVNSMRIEFFEAYHTVKGQGRGHIAHVSAVCLSPVFQLIFDSKLSYLLDGAVCCVGPGFQINVVICYLCFDALGCLPFERWFANFCLSCGVHIFFLVTVRNVLGLLSPILCTSRKSTNE
jgi:hypothetical protein